MKWLIICAGDLFALFISSGTIIQHAIDQGRPESLVSDCSWQHVLPSGSGGLNSMSANCKNGMKPGTQFKDGSDMVRYRIGHFPVALTEIADERSAYANTNETGSASPLTSVPSSAFTCPPSSGACRNQWLTISHHEAYEGLLPVSNIHSGDRDLKHAFLSHPDSGNCICLQSAAPSSFSDQVYFPAVGSYSVVLSRHEIIINWILEMKIGLDQFAFGSIKGNRSDASMIPDPSSIDHYSGRC